MQIILSEIAALNIVTALAFWDPLAAANL